MRLLELGATNTSGPLELFMLAALKIVGQLNKTLPCKQIWVYGFQSVLAVDSQGYNRALRLVRALTLIHLRPHTRWLGLQRLISKRFGGKLRCNVPLHGESSRLQQKHVANFIGLILMHNVVIVSQISKPQVSRRSVTLTFRLLPNADAKAAAVARPPGPPPMTATSTFVMQDFAAILTSDLALNPGRLQVCVR